MILNVARCPACGSSSFAVEVETWLNVAPGPDHSDEHPVFESEGFDAEDGPYAEPIEGGGIICRGCGEFFKNAPPPGFS